jgi:hypothetical protein
MLRALARFLRAIAKKRFQMLGLATIKDLPTERFNRLIEQLADDGWRKAGVYKGFDAWIDFGRLTMRRRGVRLKFEWDNWTEGSVEGPRKVIEEIAQKHDFRVTYEWRWAEYDEKR